MSRWPTEIAFVILSMIFIPLYVSILVVILRSRRPIYRSVFYTLILSTGVADLLMVFLYITLGTIRFTKCCDSIYLVLADAGLAKFYFLQIYLILGARCFGIILIALQRYICICHSGTTFDQLVINMPRWLVVTIQWLPPFILSIPIMISNSPSMVYDKDGMLDTYVDGKENAVFNIIAVIVVGFSFPFCLVCYLLVIAFIISHRSSLSSDLRREVRMTVQLVGMLAAFTLMFIFYALRVYWNITANLEILGILRLWHPLVAGSMTFITPLTIVLLNRDIASTLFGRTAVTPVQTSKTGMMVMSR